MDTPLFLSTSLIEIQNVTGSKHSTPIDIRCDVRSLHKRICAIAKQALAWFAMAIAMAVGTATLVLPAYAVIQKVRSQSQFKDMIRGLAENRRQAVIDAIKSLPASQQESQLKGNEAEKIHFSRQVEALERKIDLAVSIRSGKLHDYMQDIRNDLDKILALPIYKRNKSSKNRCVRVLQATAHAFVSKSCGMQPMQLIGARVAERVSGPISYSVLSDQLSRVYADHTIFKKASLLGKLFWIYAHPQKFMASALDQNGFTRPLDYNSYHEGNASVEVGTFVCRNASYSLSLSPSFVVDRLTEADRDYGIKRIVQDLECSYSGHQGEIGRVNLKRGLHSIEQLIHLNTPINLKEREETRAEGLDAGLQAIISEAFPGDNLDKNQQKARLLAEVSLRGLQEMQRKPFGPGDHFINQSCKQNIDRGIAVNIMTILFADAISGEDLSEERLHQIVGMFLGRAGMVDNRAILKKWFTPLKDLLQVLDENPDVIKKIQGHFTEGAIAFNASSK